MRDSTYKNRIRESADKNHIRRSDYYFWVTKSSPSPSTNLREGDYSTYRPSNIITFPQTLLSPLIFSNLHLLLRPGWSNVCSRSGERERKSIDNFTRTTVRLTLSSHPQSCCHCCTIVVCGGKLRILFYASNRPSDRQPPSSAYRKSILTPQDRQMSRDNWKSRLYP